MIRYRYQTLLHPPAPPFISVTLWNPVTGVDQRDVPAQLDTAADRTLLPQSLVQALNLPQIGTVPIGGVGGIIQSMPSYPVQLAVLDLSPRPVEVVATTGEAWILLGR